MKLGSVLKAAGKFISSHERILLTCVTIGAEVVAVAEAIKEGPTFEKIREDIREMRENGEEVKKKEVAGRCAVPVLKILIPLVLSIFAAILNHKKSSEAIQSLTSMVILGREAREAYKASVKENVEPEVAEKIKKESGEKAAEKSIKAPKKKRNVIVTGNGDDLIYDEFFNVWLESSTNYIEAARLEENSKLLDAWEYQENRCITGREWLERNGVYDKQILKFAENFVWDHNTGMIHIAIEPRKDDSNNLYAVLTYDTEPTLISWEQHNDRDY